MDSKSLEISFGNADPCEVERLFEEPAECTFPSQRYGSTCFCQSESTFQQRPPSHTKDNKRIATLDVRHYRPEEINLKVEGGEILVKGKHYCKREFGYDTSEFCRRYNLPQDCSAESIVSRISPDGVLTIEAATQNADRNAVNDFCASEKVVSDGNNFSLILDMSSFAPEDVSIEVVRGGLRVRARHETKTGGRYTSERFDRHFVLPSDVDPNTVTPSWSGNATLHLKATRRGVETKGSN